MTIVVCILITVVTIPAAILVRGAVLVSLWGYFVVPFGIQQIGMAHALGLTLFITFFEHNYQYKDKTPVEVAGTAFAFGILHPMFIWVLGCILNQIQNY